jgi:peptide deformylase
MLDIRYYGDPILRKKGARIEKFDAELVAFAEEMAETMRERDGVGLAAQQVGKAIMMAVVDPSGGEQPPIVLINPVVTAASEEIAENEEGCLSFPDIRVIIKRPLRVTVEAQELSGKPFIIENAEGLLSRALQHEIDHLNGIMIIDRISPLHRQLLSGKLKKIAKLQDPKSKAA